MNFLKVVAAVSLCVSFLGCSGMPNANSQASRDRDASNSGLNDVSLSSPTVTSIGQHETNEETPPVTLFQRGSGAFVNFEPTTSNASAIEIRDPVTLNFVSAEIGDVVHAVLGEVLGLNYVMGEGIDGQITLTTSSPIERTSVLGILESALELQGIGLIENEDAIQIVQSPLADDVGANRIRRSGIDAVGVGIEVVPLHHISVFEAARILEPFADEGSVISVDRARNILLLRGTREEIDALRQTLQIFDVDWMSEMSFAIFYPERVDVSTLTSELLAIFDRTDSPISGLVEFVPLPRINALLVISPRADHLDQVQNWIRRLDQRTNVAGPRIYYYRAQNSQAEDLAASLTSLFSGSSTPTSAPEAGDEPQQARADIGSNQLRIVPDIENNALMIYSTPEMFEVIEEALAQIDMAPAQVLIEATIVEVTLTDDLRYGVQWFLEGRDDNFTWTDVPSGAVASIFPGFSYGFRNSNIEVALNAIASVTDVDVISSPTLMVLNNRTANLQVGDQVPVTIQSAVSTSDPDAPIVSTVQFRDTGVILDVTPRINNSGVIILEVSQEVSDVAETTSSGIDSPTIRQRKISSIVAVQDGETIVLGGLMRDSRTDNRSGVPYLMNVPVLGNLFRTNSETHRRTELLIFITPHVVRDAQSARRVTDYMRRQLSEVTRRFENEQAQ